MKKQVKPVIDLLGELRILIKKVGENALTKKIEILCGAKRSSPPLIFLAKRVECEAYALSKQNWIVVLFWVIKFNEKIRKIQHPFNNDYFKFCERLGRRTYTELELWEACLDFIDDFKLSGLTTFLTAIDGWFATTQERMLSPIENRSKEAQVLLLREEINQLKTDINPHDPDKGEPELYNLINLAIAIKNPQKGDNNDLKRKRREFRDGAWAAYIKAHIEWCRHYSTSKEVKAVCIETEQLKYYVNGRQKRLVNQPLREDFRFRKKN
jgi:hypothetical protein